MTDSILNALGTGSGIDTKSMIESLVDAQFAAKDQQLSTRIDTLNTRISGVSELKSGIRGFADALNALAEGGSLTSQPSSSDSAIVQVSTLPGAKLSGLDTSLEVQQLAKAQVVNSGAFADSSATVGKGTLTLTFGTATVDAGGAMTGFTAGGASAVDITIDDSNSSLDGIAAAINAKNAGVTASIVSDADGARLILKGQTGAEQAFTLTATEDATAPGLSALNVGTGASGTTVSTAAQDALVTVDGVSLKRSTNQVKDLIAGVQLDLRSASPGTTVTIGSSLPTANLRQAVVNFVDTYNSLMASVQSHLDPKTGDLTSDTATKSLRQSLSQLTVVNLVNDGVAGEPSTLAEIGVGTNRDGTLSVNTDVLDKMLTSHADTVEKMFSPGLLSTGDGLPAALEAIATRATSSFFGLGASEKLYNSQIDDATEAQEEAAADATQMRERLTQQFASMDAKVAAYKSTQTFLENQIEAWNADS
ncbi:flagellar filament capping protein FliD [Stakelama saccharophila]|uniref:Flagellar hook-associated protein 2 n=1 Tax=Stakelama saccharophila TaxID=3075605 RepID=A0ABZ0B8E9_9SPHN|nr:flagellar filament capping protein FliD [Stakelama sp. W311]WNO53707.1 flagellar filament capping protein FliD [Stakelama sp. W311]